MRYTVKLSYVDVVGNIWMPNAPAAYRYTLSGYDVENIRAYGDGKITREAVDQWLSCHAGDFQSVTDFSASIEDGETTHDFDWSDEESEFTYNDCMFPEE